MNPIFDIMDTPKLWIGIFIFCLMAMVALGGLLEHPVNVVGDESVAVQDAKLILDSPFNWVSNQRVMVVVTRRFVFYDGRGVVRGMCSGYQALQIFFMLLLFG